jgi:hypothetical protein
MRATMLLCDAAQVVDGKLYILGGGWSLAGPGPFPMALAIKMDLEWHESDRPHHWELSLSDEDGHEVVLPTPEGDQPMRIGGELQVNRPPDLAPGATLDAVLAIGFTPMPLPGGRRYTWRLAVDGEVSEDRTISFTVRSPEGWPSNDALGNPDSKGDDEDRWDPRGEDSF